MPEGNILPKERIVDLINRALLRLFNQYWTALSLKDFQTKFPELVRISSDCPIASGSYTIDNPHKDFVRILGALKKTGSVFVKVWDESKYTLVQSGKYEEYAYSAARPAAMQQEGKILYFGETPTTIIMQYIKQPVNPETGGALTQNGTYDSPFLDHWTGKITDIAEEIFLIETGQTT